LKAVLLAAGYGTRLAPLTDSVPKILVPIAGRPLLAHQLDYLAANGVVGVAVNISYLAEQVEVFLERSQLPVPVCVSREDEPLGTAGALLPLRDFLNEAFVVLYGDVVTDAPLADLVATHRERGGLATLAYYVSDDTAGKGLIEADRDGRILCFAEKPETVVRGRVNAGIYVCEPPVLDLIPSGRSSDFGYDVWPAALAAGQTLYAVEVEGHVYDVGLPSVLETVEREIAAGSIRW
jgi:NDP-sugar pyrophosphorylase family protein